ncbi:MAG: DNA-binding response regulator KdpE, partial [Candidatus Burkholderia crenata]
ANCMCKPLEHCFGRHGGALFNSLLDVIRELRSWTELPVIVLSARTQEEEKVAVLDAGAE